jgi:FMN phosphatase YigB (HAD superfamily)
MPIEEVGRISDIWRLPQKGKWRLYRYWVHTYCANLQDKIRGKEEIFQQACARYSEVLMQEDKEIMRHSTVIGLTTTCAARYQSVLQEIGPRVIVVEEAAEVLEAHIVTTLSRRCEHLILIGDHQQLKPNPTVYKLATKQKNDVIFLTLIVINNCHSNSFK